MCTASIPTSLAEFISSCTPPDPTQNISCIWNFSWRRKCWWDACDQECMHGSGFGSCSQFLKVSREPRELKLYWIGRFYIQRNKTNWFWNKTLLESFVTRKITFASEEKKGSSSPIGCFLYLVTFRAPSRRGTLESEKKKLCFIDRVLEGSCVTISFHMCRRMH